MQLTLIKLPLHQPFQSSKRLLLAVPPPTIAGYKMGSTEKRGLRAELNPKINTLGCKRSIVLHVQQLPHLNRNSNAPPIPHLALMLLLRTSGQCLSRRVIS